MAGPQCFNIDASNLFVAAREDRLMALTRVFPGWLATWRPRLTRMLGMANHAPLWPSRPLGVSNDLLSGKDHLLAAINVVATL